MSEHEKEEEGTLYETGRVVVQARACHLVFRPGAKASPDRAPPCCLRTQNYNSAGLWPLNNC